MKIEFDQAADALYVQLAEGEIEKTEKIKPGMILDYDANGNVLGVELLCVSKRAELPLKKRHRPHNSIHFPTDFYGFVECVNARP